MLREIRINEVTLSTNTDYKHARLSEPFGAFGGKYCRYNTLKQVVMHWSNSANTNITQFPEINNTLMFMEYVSDFHVVSHKNISACKFPIQIIWAHDVFVTFVKFILLI